MRRTLIALALTVAVPCPLAAQSSTDFDEVRRILREGMVRESAPAAAFAVVRDGKVIWEEGIGWADSVNNRRATPDSPFLLASLNKTFETTLAAVLQARGSLDLDQPVNKYLRTTAISSPAWDATRITVRQLYMHTAGLSTFDIYCDAAARDQCHMPNADDIIRDYGIVGGKPGERFDSDFGTAVVSHSCPNDNTVEGITCLETPAFSVQYHPEAAAGPHDAACLFDRFCQLMSQDRKSAPDSARGGTG